MMVDDLRADVFEALDNAHYENEYDMTKDDAHDVACDMIAYGAAFENYKPETLIPHIKEWQAENR